MIGLITLTGMAYRYIWFSVETIPEGRCIVAFFMLAVECGIEALLLCFVHKKIKESRRWVLRKDGEK